MPSEAAADATESFAPRDKLHPVSWLFVAVGHVKQFLLALIAAVVVGSSRDYGLWWPLVVIVPLVAAALWHQKVYRYGFSERGLVIHEGLFFRNVRTIDYHRIENVNTQRSLLHRLLGVAEVRVETSTGGKAEALIRVLDLHAVREMRDHVFRRAAEQRGARGLEDANAGVAAEAPAALGGAPAAGETLIALEPSELVRLGLVDNRGVLVVAGVLGFLGQGGYFENIEERAAPLADRLPWELVTSGGWLGPLLAAATFVGLIVATRLLSVVVALVKLYGFRLTLHGEDLHARFGLLTRVAVTVRRRRIQAVHQTATLLHRAFGRVSLRMDLAGGLAPAEGQQSGGQGPRREHWLAPICRPDDVERLVRAALPQVRLAGLDWQRLAPRARTRLFRLRSAIWLALAAIPAVQIAGLWAPAIALAPLPLIWLHAHLYVKHSGWALHEEFLVLRRGWLTRKLSIAPRNRVQCVRLVESPFDRRHRMARVELDHAGAGALGLRLAIPYLERGDAARLAGALYRSELSSGAEPTMGWTSS